MRCSQARQSLHDNESGLPRAAVWAHLARCSHCRAEARSLRALREAVREAGQIEPPADLLPSLLAVPRGDLPHPNTAKEKTRMRRIVFASLAMLAIAIAAALAIPGRGPQSRADSILLGVAHAMADASSLHAVFRTTETAKDMPSGLRIMPGRGEHWMDSRHMVSRYLAPDGTLTMAGGVDLDGGKFWFYKRKDGTRYVADLAPISTRAAQVISKWSRKVLAGQINDILGAKLRHAKKSVATVVRDGREVAIVTVTFPYRTSPRRVTLRTVFEVDAATNHLLTMRQYAKAEGAAEQLVATVDEVEYGAPLPADLAELELPEGTKTVKATPKIVRSKDTLSLVIKAGGKEINRFDVPRNNR